MSIRVLIAEPDEALLQAFHDYLSEEGFELNTATTGNECAEKLADFAPDVLVLEHDLPDGWSDRLLELM